MIDPSDPKIREAVDAISKQLIDEGKLIEAGWASYRMLVIPANAPEVQIRESRQAFLSGAQHLFHTITSVLDPGTEPTDDDIRRMEMIDAELRQLRDEMLLRLGVRRN